MRRSLKSLSIAAAVAASLPAGIAAITASAAVVPASSHLRLVAGAAHARLISQRRLPGGDYAATWHVFGGTVTAAGPAGSVVRVTKPTSASRGGVSITAPAATRKTSADASAAASVRSGKSVYANARAVGFSPAQARHLAGEQRAALRHRGITAAIAQGTIMSNPCASYTAGDSGHAWERACDVQVMMQDKGSGNWVLGDKITGSGSDNSTGLFSNSLEKMDAYVTYGANNSIIQWQPNSTIFGSCAPVGLSTTYGGFTIADSANVCATGISPVGPPSATKFGAIWNGCDWNDVTEGVDAVDVDNNPSNASSSVTLHIDITWGFCLG